MADDETRLDRQLEQNELLGRRCDMLQAERDALKQRVAELETECAALQRAYVMLDVRFSRLEAENNELKAIIRALDEVTLNRNGVGNEMEAKLEQLLQEPSTEGDG